MIAQHLNEIAYWKLIKEVGSFNDKWNESVATKANIFHELIKNIDGNAKTLLFATFNPIAIYLAKFYAVSIICSENLTEVFDLTTVSIINDVTKIDKKFDVVLALDEYLTFSPDELDQRDQLEKLAKVTGRWLITTLQDYKNFAPHKKNQIDTIGINSEHNYIMLENSSADNLDKQAWDHYFYCIKDHLDLLTIGPMKRRTMYFKQLAKYSSDAGSKQYVIQKNLLYKGFFSKNFEHIITVNFE